MATPGNDVRRWRTRSSLSFWVVVSAVVLLSIVAVSSGGFRGLVIALGIVAICSALHVVITGRSGWLKIPSRKIGLGVLVAGLVVSGSGAALAGPAAPNDSALRTTNPSVLIAESMSSTPTPTPSPVVEMREEVVTAEVPFASVNRDDPNSQVGTNSVTTPGANGVQSTTFRVTTVDGVETARQQILQTLTTAPVDQVTSIGTRPVPAPAAPIASAPSGCDTNYSGCVPIASDVDCPGGSGNGPAYADGVVQVIGSDIYDLDRDGNGYGCD
jgi:hypothetical protein